MFDDYINIDTTPLYKNKTGSTTVCHLLWGDGVKVKEAGSSRTKVSNTSSDGAQQDLQIIALRVTGLNSNDFTLTQASGSPVASGDSTPLAVSFRKPDTTPDRQC